MRISVIGNCQAKAVADVVQAAIEPTSPSRVLYVSNYADASQEQLRGLAASDVIVEQVTDRPPKALRDVTDSIPARRIFIPLLACSFLYPFSNRAHPRAASSISKAFPAGCYEGQLSDTQLIDLMSQNRDQTASGIVDRYLSLDYNKIVSLDQLFEFNRQKTERSGAISGLNLWPKIEALFRYEPVFWTSLHPARALLQTLCRFALDQLGGLSEEKLENAARSIEEKACAHMPVHPSIVRHFGIEWATPHFGYRFMQEGKFTAREFARRFVDFEFDGELLEAIAGLSADPPTEARDLLALLATRPPNAELFGALAAGFAKKGDVPNSLAAAISSLELDYTNRDIAALVCNLVRLILPDNDIPVPLKN